MTQPKVLLIGQNPSIHNISEQAFVGSRSGDVLVQWLLKLELYDFDVLNFYDKFGRDFTKQDVKEATERLSTLLHQKEYTHIIALGGSAYKGITNAVSPYPKNIFKLDHPSHLNRRLNDSFYVKDMLDKCKHWITTTGGVYVSK